MKKESNKSQLGVFWGNNMLYFVESSNTDILKSFSVSLEQQPETQGEYLTSVAGNMQTTSMIQNSLIQHNVITGSVNLSLPTHDIIFRSFVIPWMQSNEIKSVVEFEVIKYIPFTLDELSFSFHPMTIVENNVKRIRIVFVAIKRIALEKYITLLEQASLSVDIIEPAPVSLIRFLVHKELLSLDETYALVEKEESSGKIIIIDKGIPQFVREFQIKSRGAGAADSADGETFIIRLINEIRISLDYFNRQENLIQITEVLLITPGDNENLAKRFEDDLRIKTRSISIQKIIQAETINDASYISSCGASLIGSVAYPANFDLSDEKTKSVKLKTAIELNFDIKSIIKIAVICIPLIGISFFLAQQMIKGPQKKIVELKVALGPNIDLSTTKLEDKNKKQLNNLAYIKNLRLSSNVSFFLETIPSLLPQGAWLNSLQISYKDSSSTKPLNDAAQKPFEPIISLSGYVYSEDAREQFRLVNQLLNSMESNKDFSRFFQKIDLQTVESQRLDDFQVTFFKISCQ